MRTPLLGNVHDELGSGDLYISHERTFLAFLSRFGVTLEGKMLHRSTFGHTR